MGSHYRQRWAHRWVGGLPIPVIDSDFSFYRVCHQYLISIGDGLQPVYRVHQEQLISIDDV